jgi:hypothetical protein
LCAAGACSLVEWLQLVGYLGGKAQTYTGCYSFAFRNMMQQQTWLGGCSRLLLL